MVVRKVLYIYYPDDKGKVYCRSRNAVVILDFRYCQKCGLLAGSAQGEGVECLYLDVEEDGKSFKGFTPHHREKRRIDGLIRQGIISVKPGK